MKHLLATIVLTVCLVVCFNCGALEKLSAKQAPPQPSPTSDQGTAIHIRLGKDAPQFDPALASAYEPRGACLPLVFSSLTGMDGQGKAIPRLAETWETRDGLIWTIRIRADIVWARYNPQSGAVESVRRVTSHDVVYGFHTRLELYLTGELVYEWLIQGVDEALSVKRVWEDTGIRAVDDRTLEITFTQPFEDFPAALGLGIYPIPQELVEQYGKDWAKPEHLWSSGLYLPILPQEEGRVTLIKNSLHPLAGDSRSPQRIAVIYGLDPHQALEMYDQGTLDMVALPASDGAGLSEKYGEALHYAQQMRVVGMIFNPFKPPFDNPAMVRAFEQAIDLQKIGEIVGKDAPGVFPCPKVFSAPEHTPLTFDPELARLDCQIQGWCADYPDQNPWGLKVQAPADERACMLAKNLGEGWREQFVLSAEEIACVEDDFEFELIDAFERELIAHALTGDPQAREKLAADEAPNIFIFNYPLIVSEDAPQTFQMSLERRERMVEGEAEVLLYLECPDIYLIRPETKEALTAMNWKECMGVSVSGMYDWATGCMPPAPPGALQLGAQCMDAVKQAQEAEKQHDCERWLPLAAKAVHLADKALSQDSRLAEAYYCRGLAEYLLGELPKSLEDFQHAQEIGVSDDAAYPLETWLPYVRQRLESPACQISKIRFVSGWQNGKPILSDTYDGKDLTKIEVSWELKGDCPSECMVIWTLNNTTKCWHNYGSQDIPHSKQEGSLYYEEEGQLKPGRWEVKVVCGGKEVGAAAAEVR
ncbi:MAG: hypothetical protein HPY45_14425 [Anaerolineae bacterium]|nr:hypothetical protein [Anaerolineae bacterium]